MTANRFSFRAWDKRTGKWIHKEPCHLIGETILLGEWLDGVSIKHLNDVIVMQSTGLCDKTGKEIFEGDVVRQSFTVLQDAYNDGVVTDSFEGETTGVAKNIPSMGACICNRRTTTEEGTKKIEGYKNIRSYRAEIIGNIYENPELLKETP